MSETIALDLVKLGELFANAAFLVVVVNRLVDGLAEPLYKKLSWDKFSLMYVSWGLGALVVALARVNLFYFVDWVHPAIGYVFSAIVAGGGANLLHDIFDIIPRGR